MSSVGPEFEDSRTPEEIVQFAVQIDLTSRCAQLLEASDLATLTDRLASHYQISKKRLYAGVLGTARLVEPRDSILGINEEMPGAIAFAHGALLGVFTARTLMGPHYGELDSVIEAFYAGMTPEGATPEETAHTIMDAGGQGLRRAEAAEELIERVESATFSDITQHVYFKHGFGYIMYLVTEYLIGEEADKQAAKAAKERADLEALAELAALDDFDWHDLLK